jgi:hypothetical protein
MTGPVARRRTAALPAFSRPDAPPSPSPLATAESPDTLAPWKGDQPGPVDEPGALQRDLPIPRPAPSATRTGTSVTSDEPEADPKVVVGLVVALTGIGITAAAVAVRRFRGRRLRKPTTTQVRAFARPVADILLRHFDLVRLNKDLASAVEAAGAVGAYIDDGPLTEPDTYARDSGVPHDLQEPPE